MIRRCLSAADERQVQSLAIPPVGAGNLGYPPESVARMMCDVLGDYVQSNPGTNLRDIRFVAIAEQRTVIAVSFPCVPRYTENCSSYPTEVGPENHGPMSYTQY